MAAWPPSLLLCHRPAAQHQLFGGSDLIQTGCGCTVGSAQYQFGVSGRLSNVEIGELMDKSESAVKSLYFRTLSSLRQDLEARGWGTASHDAEALTENNKAVPDEQGRQQSRSDSL